MLASSIYEFDWQSQILSSAFSEQNSILVSTNLCNVCRSSGRISSSKSPIAFRAAELDLHSFVELGGGDGGGGGASVLVSWAVVVVNSIVVVGRLLVVGPCSLVVVVAAGVTVVVVVAAAAAVVVDVVDVEVTSLRSNGASPTSTEVKGPSPQAGTVATA